MASRKSSRKPATVFSTKKPGRQITLVAKSSNGTFTPLNSMSHARSAVLSSKLPITAP